jgi:hypothetical protein
MLKQISPLLQVSDLKVSVSFYGEKLGFRTGSTEGGFSIVRRDDCAIFLAQKTKDTDVTNKAARAGDEEWCNYDAHIHCEPGTLDALYREFKAKGVKMPEYYRDGPVARPYGMRDFSVIDPDGYDLVFGESPAGAKDGPEDNEGNDIEAIRKLAPFRTFACECGAMVRVHALTIYAKCQKCRSEYKTRAFGGIGSEIQDVIDAVLEWAGISREEVERRHEAKRAKEP